jgi:DNA-directed DNA polymerase III PolC
MKVSPHTHLESPLTGSTIASFITRAREIGRKYIAYTDHGHLSSAMKMYRVHKEMEKKLDEKIDIKYILGSEVYFKDSTCPIVVGSGADRCKYFTVSVYARDQDAYQAMCKIMSREDMPTVEINGESQALWGWAELRQLALFNIEVVLGGPHCMVGKVMLAGRPDLAQKVLEELKSLFQDRLTVSLVCEPWTKKFSQVIQVEYADGTTDSLLGNDQVSTDRARRMKASDLIERSGHSLIKSRVSGGMSYEVNKTIKKVKLHKGFLPLPGGDALLKTNKLLQALAMKHGINVIVSDYAYYAHKEDKIVQTMRLEGNNKLQPSLHMKDDTEILNYLTEVMGLNSMRANMLIEANDQWADRFKDFKLEYTWRLADTGGDPMKQAMEIIKANGRMRWNDPKYVARLKEELEVIAKNPKKDLTGYFLPIRDVLNHYRENGLLTGPGRGSAGGSLFVYCLGITQIDPFDFDLPFNRFFSLDRIMGMELPDIDVDLEERTLLVGTDGRSGYLYGKYGNMAAQCSTRTTIRLKSAITDTNRYFKGKVEDEIKVFTKGLPAPPQGVTDLDFVFGFEDDEDTHHDGLLELSEDLQKYAASRPEEWAIVSKAMGLTRAYSSHASAFVLSDVPIKDILPTKEGHITQYEAKEVEAAKLIKYDFLVVKQLKDIRVCMDLINRKNGTSKVVGNFDHKDKDTYVWKLEQLPEVFKSIWAGATETCFQINTRSMTPFVIEMQPNSMMDIATLLALVRPGPMDFINPDSGRNMVEEYMMLRKGQIKPDIESLGNLLPETYGVIVFQEQLNKIARDLAGFPGPQAETLRKHMAKKNMTQLMKMKPDFIAGASKNVDVAIAEQIWERMVTFGRYGFSVIHAVEYAHITYACMFLKHYYPLEWWASILTNATEQEISGKFWPYVREMVAAPDINLSSDEMVVDYANQKIRAKFGVIRGIGDNTIDPIVEGRPYKDIQDFVDKGVAGPSLSHKLIHVGVLDSLFPAKSTLETKLMMYEQAKENKDYAKKIADKTPEQLARMRSNQPRDAKMPEGYANLHPMVDAAMKKAVLPSMSISTSDLGSRYSQLRDPYALAPHVKNIRNQSTRLINGEQLQRLDEIPGESIEKDIYVASTAYIVKAEEFAYSNNTKRALKMIIDVDGYVSEKVLWPDYETQKLMYPETLKKGAIATFFFRKRANKKDMAIQQIQVES